MTTVLGKRQMEVRTYSICHRKEKKKKKEKEKEKEKKKKEKKKKKIRVKRLTLLFLKLTTNILWLLRNCWKCKWISSKLMSKTLLKKAKWPSSRIKKINLFKYSIGIVWKEYCIRHNCLPSSSIVRLLTRLKIVFK